MSARGNKTSIKTFDLLLRHAQIDADLLINDTEDLSVLSPATTDWDGESFQFTWVQSFSSHFDESEKDIAREVYLAAFWIAIEHYQSLEKVR